MMTKQDLSKAAIGAGKVASEFVLLTGLKKYQEFPFDATINREGIVNCGTAENRLLWTEILAKLNKPSPVTSRMLEYPTFYGSPNLRTLVAALLTEKLKVQDIEAKNITCHAGCGAAVSNVIQALCDPDDYVLIPTPFYGGFDADVTLYSRAQIMPVASNENNGVMPTIASLEDAFEKCPSGTCKVLLLTNPGNPTGTIIPVQLLQEMLEWANGKDIQVIVDEIYALSVFRGSFQSIYSLPNLPNPEKTHMIWGISKDFCMNGLRMGCVISRNTKLLDTLHMFSLFTNMSQLTDAMVCNVLSDQEWVKDFHGKNLLALETQLTRFTSILAENNVPFVDPTSAFFIWVDLRRFMSSQTFAGEMELWNEFLEAGLLISPGCAFHNSTPGWFRIVYSFEWDSHFSYGVERFLKVLKAHLS